MGYTGLHKGADMYDQAQGLRELAAKVKEGLEREITPGVPLTDVEFEEMQKDVAAKVDVPGELVSLAKLMAMQQEIQGSYTAKARGYAPATPDKAKLWDDLKAELEQEGRGLATGEPGQHFTDTHFSVEARRFLDRMLQAETLATLRGHV